MLSWASNDAGVEVDLTEVANASGVPLEHGDLLLEFATACAQSDDVHLANARVALVEAVDEAFMVDAAAVAANFEMMTRLADGTGARMPAESLERSAATIGAMGVGELTSRR